jgi:hypothetical protein
VLRGSGVRRWPALVHESNEAVERRVRAVETKTALDLDAVERTVARIERPDLLADRLAASIRYSQRVEAEVADLGIETLLPYATDDYDARFLEVWVPDERGHGTALEMLLDALGLPTYEARPADTVPFHNRLAGRLGRITAHAYEMVSLTYHAIGAMNERLAMAAYTRMAELCRGEIGGEPGSGPDLDALADILLVPMRRDESLHLGYYRTYARQLRQRMAPWKVALVRLLVVHTYAPVGAGLQPDKGPLGEVLLELEHDPDDPATARMVQAVAEELLAAPGRELPPFVRTELLACLALARESRATHATSIP